jgi:hypothetical protein
MDQQLLKKQELSGQKIYSSTIKKKNSIESERAGEDIASLKGYLFPVVELC